MTLWQKSQMLIIICVIIITSIMDSTIIYYLCFNLGFQAVVGFMILELDLGD